MTGAGAVLLALALLSAAGTPEALAYLAPALLLMAPLLLGRYPGEHALLPASKTRAPVRASRPADRCSPGVHARSGRGGRLLAAALAGRAPPAVSMGRAGLECPRRQPSDTARPGRARLQAN